MNRVKMFGAASALVGSALIGGTLFSSVLAAPATTQTTTTVSAHGVSSEAYVNAYLDTLASELGVDRASLGPAALAAAEAAVDAAVEAGDITADRAAEIKADLEALDDPASILVGRGAFAGDRGGDRGGPGLGIHDAFDAAAASLGIDASDLVGQLRDGSSLMEIATAQEVDYSDVVSAVTDAVSSDQATAVTDGRITQDQSDQVMTDLQTWLDAGGQADSIPFGIGHGGHGPRDGFGF